MSLHDRYLKYFTLRIMALMVMALPIFLIIGPGWAQHRPANAAILQGIVTNGVTGSPVVGAKVVVNGHKTRSTAGGIYAVTVDPTGNFPVFCTKAGYGDFTSQPVLFQPGSTVTLNIQLWENLTPPGNVNVHLDTASGVVPVAWEAPSGPYELLYDDGIQDNFTVWAAQGNMNAMKFTPAGFPARVMGGAIHIGSQGNYPTGSNPVIPFQVKIFDASGPGGSPGNSLAGPFEVVPAATGWVEFTLPGPVTVNSGAFYIVMVQGGNAPNAAGIAIDETTPQFRSYSRYITGGGPWFPAGGNFMIRAVCEGPGGPPALSDNHASADSYILYRLRQGEEQNPTAWTTVATLTATSMNDPVWPALPCGPYRWGVKAGYPGNRWSPVAFSNILGKCWTAQVNLQLVMSCDSAKRSGTFVKMVNQAYPDTSYARYSDSTGAVSFAAVWKGNYRITALRFGYDTLHQTLPVTGQVAIGLNLMQVRTPPVNLVVDDSSLMARWDVPHYEKELFSEDWSGGTLAGQSWTVEGGVNWTLSMSTGKPAPSAIFSSLPQLVNYEQSLVSKIIHGENSTLLKLKYDILLDNYANTTLNQMAAEIWDGSAWHVLLTYNNLDGDIPWTRADIDISDYTANDFRIRFRASGGNSVDINSWNIDNIDIMASEPAQEQNDCILGYYFYLDNVISGYTAKNAYPIPGNQVQYGQTYNACVRAIYGSGYSDPDCATFTSRFLYPVTGIYGYPVENTACITWEKPMASNDTSMVVPPGLLGYVVFRDDSVIANIPNPDSLAFFDYNLEPGYYQYWVSAMYDLAYYGVPGQVGNSQPAGPLHITITWGRDLPFLETWDAGSFSFNEWRFNPAQGNWGIDQAEGDPAPSAGFKWQSPVVNYSYALESPPFNGLPFTCAAIWLDFNMKLNDRNSSGTEHMNIEVYYNNIWHTKAVVANSGNFQWTPYHIDISAVHGKGFRVRFRASGSNSSEIQDWLIDNIHIYPVCYPAANVAGEAYSNIASLTWSPPACYGGILLLEGFEQSAFPPPQWNVLSTNPAATWSHMPANAIPGVHSGNFSAGINWDYNHQDEWLIAENVYVNGDLTFWSYAFQGSLHLDHYYVKASVDNGNTWTVLLDMSALPPYPGPNGVNSWITPYTIDLSVYEGETIDIAWHAIDGDGNGLWYPWAIDDCIIGNDDNRARIAMDHRQTYFSNRVLQGNPVTLQGYDIYRKGLSTAAFEKINPTVVTDTTWMDENLTAGQYYYFIRAIFEECSRSMDSDTILIDIITGVQQRKGAGIMIFPNPSPGIFTISSTEPVSKISLFTASGSHVVTRPVPGEMQITVETGDHAPGIYLLRVCSGETITFFKVCILNKN